MPVTSVNTADYQVTGARLKGRVGDTVTMKVKFTNAGPAWVLREEGDRRFNVLVTPPAGTSVVTPHGYCDAKGAVYACGTSERWVNEGGGETYTFKLKIDKQVAGAKGSVALSTEARPFDPDKANDRADITLDVTGDGSTGGSTGTSTGGSGTSTGNSSGGSGTTTVGSSATGGSGSSSAGGTGPAATGGDLASTGSSEATLPLVGAATAAVGLGAGAILVARRRRAQSGS